MIIIFRRSTLYLRGASSRLENDRVSLNKTWNQLKNLLDMGLPFGSIIKYCARFQISWSEPVKGSLPGTHHWIQHIYLPSTRVHHPCLLISLWPYPKKRLRLNKQVVQTCRTNVNHRFLCLFFSSKIMRLCNRKTFIFIIFYAIYVFHVNTFWNMCQ